MQLPEDVPTVPAGTLGVVALDHAAVAVRNLDAAVALYRDLLGGRPEKYREVPGEGFRFLALRYPNGGQVELLAPIGERGFLHRFLERHGEGPHHFTFVVADLRRAVERARAAGLRVVDEDYGEPTWQEAFVSPRSAAGTLIQLAQSSLDDEQRARRMSAHAWLSRSSDR